MCKSYMPSVPIKFIAASLGYDDDEEAAFFVTDHGAQLMNEGAHLDCKTSRPQARISTQRTALPSEVFASRRPESI